MTMQLSLPVGARHAAPEQRRAPIASRWRGIAAIRRCCCNDETPHALPVGARHAAPEQRRARTASRPNSAAPEQRRAPTVLPWRGVAAIRRCRSCRSNEASSRLMPVGARHAALPTASRPNSVAPQLCCLGVASLQSGAAAVVALMKLHRVSCPSGRGMPRPQQRRARTAPRPNSVAPEQRRARTASRWRGVAAIRRCRSCRSNEASSRLMPVGARHAAPEQRRARTAPRPNSAAPEQRRARTASRPNSAALAWRRCNPARQRSRWDRHSAAGCACAPPRRHQSAQECRKLCYRRHPPARSRSRRRGVPFGCMALI